MNFTKDFDSDYVKIGRMDLDWIRIEQDLATIAQDQERNGSIIGTNTGDALSGIMNEYQRYGYTVHNTKLWKTTNAEPKITFGWESDIARQLPLDRAIVTVTRQDPGQILPWHRDRFFFLRKHYPQDPRPIWRFLVFLSPWKTGHFLQVADSVLHHWQQGDVVVWQPDTEHLAANVGLEQKWTANVTGFLTV